MIKSLHVRNYQIHKRLDLELDPHVTIIVGSSDAGKSSLLRALRWLATNRPLGDSFVRHGAGFVSVAVSVDGRSVKRSKGGRDGNVFVLDGGKLAAPGTEVPSPIAELLNIDPDLNFQRQRGKDPDFWFALTPGEVAKELNAVVNLSLIDRTLANAAAEARRVRSIVSVSEERLSKAKKAAEELAWVREADKDLKLLEAKEAELAEKRSRIVALTSAIEQGKELARKQKRLTGLKISGAAAIAAGERAIAAAARLEAIESAIAKYHQLSKKLADSKAELDAINDQLAQVDTCPACGGRLYSGKAKA